MHYYEVQTVKVQPVRCEYLKYLVVCICILVCSVGTCGVGKSEGKRPLGVPRFRWRIILKWIFRQWDVGVQTGLSWLGIGKEVGTC
jgi:hypothetical protein